MHNIFQRQGPNGTSVTVPILDDETNLADDISGYYIKKMQNRANDWEELDKATKENRNEIASSEHKIAILKIQITELNGSIYYQQRAGAMGFQGKKNRFANLNNSDACRCISWNKRSSLKNYQSTQNLSIRLNTRPVVLSYYLLPINFICLELEV